jgi:phosphoribosylformylglycinamidine cyclo-ligase
VPRILPAGVTAVIDTRAWEVPGIFRLIAERGRVSAEEMYEVFNMGIGLVLMVAAEEADGVIAAVPGAVRIGEVRAWTGRPVELLGLA